MPATFGEQDLATSILAVLGHISRDQGDLADARERYEASLRISRARDDTRGIARALLALGRLALIRGAVADGLALLQESLRRYREAGDLTDITRVLLLLGGAACDLGRLDQAREQYRVGLKTAVELRDRGRLAANLNGSAVLAAAQGRSGRASTTRQATGRWTAQILSR